MNEGQANLGSIVLEGGASEPMRVRLISGQQPVLGTHGYNVAELVDIADTYGLDGAWVNVQVAEALGIQTGDMLALSNDNASCTAKAFVTQRIVPTAVYLPSGFGHTSDKQREACGNGFNPALFSDAVVEAGYGTLCTQEACVTLEKVGE